MNIPDKIIESLETLEPATRGQVYCALISYMDNEDPQLPFEMTPEATEAWLQTKAVLDPILRRRRRQRERRMQLKQIAQNQQHQKQEQQGQQGQQEQLQQQSAPPEIPLNRRQRRALERHKRKMAVKGHPAPRPALYSPRLPNSNTYQVLYR